MKLKSVWLTGVGLFLFSVLAWAAPPQDYQLGYVFKNPDGSVFRIIRYYLRDGNKYRAEYLTTVQAGIDHTDAMTEQLPAGGAQWSSSTKMTVERLPSDAAPQGVEILRKDKGLVWNLMAASQSYSQAPLRQDAWDYAYGKNFVSDCSGFKKIGATRLLNYSCDIYQTEEDGWSNIITVARDSKVILKIETFENGKLAETMEALEFRTEKPAAALFEIPDGYKKNQ